MRFISIHTLSLLAVTILISRHSHAQNLIPKPGFEQYVANPNVTGSGVNESIAWEKLDNTTDFFHRAYGSALHGIPLNFRGYQETASGSGYAGIRTYPALTGEFLVARLSAPLEKGQMYQAGFQANLSNLATYATDDIGMAFFYDIPEEQSVRDSIFHIKNPEGRFLTDTVDWTEVSGYYLARGGEQYALLGNFAAPRDVNVIVNVENNDMPWAYYYIDDVVVEPCDTQRIEQGTVLDTVICEGAPLVLSGMEGTSGKAWARCRKLWWKRQVITYCTIIMITVWPSARSFPLKPVIATAALRSPPCTALRRGWPSPPPSTYNPTGYGSTTPSADWCLPPTGSRPGMQSCLLYPAPTSGRRN